MISSALFLDGFGTPFRSDRNRNGGGIMFFNRNDTPAKVFATDDKSIERFYLRAKFPKEKMVIEMFLKP